MGQFIQLENFSKIAPYMQLFKQGLLVTVLLSLFTVVIGFCIALVLALMRMSNVRPLRNLGLDANGHLREGGFLALVSRFNPLSFLATAYVEVLRSTPVLVQIFIVYYGVFSFIQLPSFQMFGFIKFDRFFPGVVALGMNSGAYLCEIIRAGIQSIANEFVVIIKESAITYTIGVQDIMSAVNAVKGATFVIVEPLLVATAVYFCLCFPTSKIIAYFERRMSHGDKR